ncbi:MAG: hypothetical protein AAFU49_17655 [Pseudomonadota bacterium]
MPIGGLEDVAKVNPYPEELMVALQIGKYRLDEVKAVLEAGCVWGKAEVTAGEPIEGLGIKRAAEEALKLWALAHEDHSGNSDAAANLTSSEDALISGD